MNEGVRNISGDRLKQTRSFDLVCPDLLRSFEGSRGLGQAMYRREPTPDGEVETLAMGVALVLRGDETSSGDRGLFAAAYAGFDEATGSLTDEERAGLRLIGWSTFDPEYPRPTWGGFSRRMLYVPEVLIEKRGDLARVTLASVGEPVELVWERWRALVVGSLRPEVCSEGDLGRGGIDSEIGSEQGARVDDEGLLKTHLLDVERFRRGIGHVVHEGAASKVVLARRALIEAPAPIDVGATLLLLGKGYPSCTLFALAPEGRAVVFIGATPERLVAVEEGEISTMALAGTTRHEAGARTTRQGAEQDLLGSSKDLEEHGFVVEMILEQLAPLCASLEAAREPGLRRLANVSHLETPIKGQLLEGAGLLDAVDALHPTPAVCGVPRKEAREMIRELEGYDRGLYAGTLGWLDGRGNGAFDVALRCGLIEGSRALLYAGAGITAESDVDVEWAETARKFDALRGAIGEVCS